MKIFGRSLARVVRAPFGRHHWIAAINMARIYDQPIDAARRYVFALGSYPHTFRLRTPMGPVSAKAWSFHDVMTINEIFCRRDYWIDPRDRVVVDFGSNIGLSALYFLTHAPRSFVYCHEPLPRNCERLAKTLEDFADRYRLSASAVASYAGKVNFGYETTGRYGGIGLGFPRQIEIDCLRAQDVIAAVLRDHGKIDLLKIDIEGLERDVLLSLPRAQLERIEKIYAETSFDAPPLTETHSMRQYGTVAQFERRGSAGPAD
jgi:FkbM family methyltransferase